MQCPKNPNTLIDPKKKIELPTENTIEIQLKGRQFSEEILICFDEPFNKKNRWHLTWNDRIPLQM